MIAHPRGYLTVRGPYRSRSLAVDRDLLYASIMLALGGVAWMTLL